MLWEVRERACFSDGTGGCKGKESFSVEGDLALNFSVTQKQVCLSSELIDKVIASRWSHQKSGMGTDADSQLSACSIIESTPEESYSPLSLGRQIR